MSQSFKPCAWLANIDFIKRLVMMNHLLIVVMSEAGGGKSTFVELMRQKFGSAIQTTLIKVKEEASDAAFVEELYSQQLGLFPADSGSLGLRSTAENFDFDDFFKHLSPPKHPLLLVIDDAERLTSACLSSLLQAYKKHAFEKKCHLCLVSDFSLLSDLRKLEQESGWKNFIHTIEPGALTEAETKTFVMRYADGQKGLFTLLSRDQFKRFYILTQGRIAAIHRQLQILKDKKTHKQPHVKSLLKLLPSLVFALVVFIGMILNLKPSSLPSSVAATPVVEAPEILASYVSPWYAHAQMQVVEPPPLKKYVTFEAQDELQFNEQLAVVDKVLLIPKVG